MSDTPETDAVIQEVVITSDAGDSLPKYTAMLKHARRLERQRDAYAETIELILANLNVAYAAETRETIRERHPELAENEKPHATGPAGERP